MAFHGDLNCGSLNLLTNRPISRDFKLGKTEVFWGRAEKRRIVGSSQVTDTTYDHLLTPRNYNDDEPKWKLSLIGGPFCIC